MTELKTLKTAASAAKAPDRKRPRPPRPPKGRRPAADQPPPIRLTNAERTAFIQQVQEIAGPLLPEMSLDLVEIQYQRESGRLVLRLTVDRLGPAPAGQPGGVSLDELTKLSRELSLLLDLADLGSERYVLEVSSPGLDRRLNYPADFHRYQGRLAALRVRTEEGHKLNVQGVLEPLGPDGLINIKPAQGPLVIVESERLISARLVPELNWRGLQNPPEAEPI